MSQKLFLIDAYALIYRSYYALIRAPRINSKGLNTSAIMGFCNTLNEVLQKEKPTHLAVAFDHGKTFRHEVFADYKAQREETPEDIRRAIPIIKDILKAYRIPILQVDGFEADDVIGTIAKREGNDGSAGGDACDVFMLTPDKDYAQLVSDHVFMYRPRHGGGYEVMGPKEVCEKYGIDNTDQVIDLLGLMGDSSDNYQGCPGVGEKTAVKLILEFGSIEGLLSNTDKLKGKMKEKVEGAIEDIKLSKYLATIRTDVPVTTLLDEMAVQNPDEEKLDEIFTELEFKTLKEKLLGKKDTIVKKSAQKQKSVNGQLDLFGDFMTNDSEDVENSNLTRFNSADAKYVLVDNEEDMASLCGRLTNAKEFAFDTETTSTVALDAELVGLSFALNEKEAFYVPVPSKREEAQKVLEAFRAAYESAHVTKVVQNGKYDIQVLANYGIDVKGPLWDTMVAHYLINPELHHNMDYMAETLLGYETIHIEELIGPKGRGQKSMRDVPVEKIKDYAAEDADITLRLKNVLEPMLKEKGCEKLFHEVEMPLIPVLVEMERNGVTLDTKALSEVQQQMAQRVAEIEHEIYELAGESFNIASPRQVGDILFGKLQIVEKAKKTKTGQYVTSEEVLQSLRNKHDIVGKILDYRGLKKLLGTYVEALPKLINPRTGRIHTSYNQCVTATGRLSSSDPNLQNIPVRSEDGKEIRRCFVAEEGDVFFSADYSQVELRIMASLSGDKNMIEAFTSGQDIHAATSAKIYKKPIEEVTKDERRKAKSANFGIIYGISAFGLAQGLDIDRHEAKALIDGYFESFPQVNEFIEKCKATAAEKGYAETLMGRRRYLPDITSHNGTVRAFAERNAVNAPIQGTAADIMKVAMIRVFNRLKEEGLKAKMILQVHDELNFSVPASEKEQVERIVIEEMQNACHNSSLCNPLAVPLIADSGWG
ncbi:MAG: DNA polymerase I, partial [Prevotella sp.]|nr:DNA polymerase I [Candidatus Prevotella equi]